ncbi:MAG TPA: hypothetical protein VLE27_07860 [Thermoanaerobaculia bacterium]|nr:hypothetical protein [Thermoanaerobaculia bacterium]
MIYDVRYQGIWLPARRTGFPKMIFMHDIGHFQMSEIVGALQKAKNWYSLFLEPIKEKFEPSAWITAKCFLSFVGLASILIALASNFTAPWLFRGGLVLLASAAAFVVNWRGTRNLILKVSPFPKVKRPPGSKLMEVADFFFSSKTVEKVYAPLIADLQLEYIDALSRGRRHKARWVRMRGYWSFWNAVGLQSLVSTAQKVYSLWRVVK